MNISLKSLEDRPQTEADDSAVEHIDFKDVENNAQSLSQELLGRTITEVLLGTSMDGATVLLLRLDAGSTLVVEYGSIGVAPAPFTIDRIHPINPTQQ